MPSVEQRHRQQIYYTKFQAEHNGEHREVGKPLMGLTTGHLRNHDWAAERVANRDRAGEDTRDTDYHLGRQFDRSRARLLHRAERAEALDRLIAARLHADNPGRRGGAVDGLLI